MAVMLSACGVAASIGSSGLPATAAAAGKSAASTTTEAPAPAAAEPPSHPGQLMRDQIETLRGMTPDAAIQRLAQLGHDGKVTVGVVVQFDPTCGQNKVCATSRDGGMGIHDDIELALNPQVTISAPPP
jgi:hypothetical protein